MKEALLSLASRRKPQCRKLLKDQPLNSEPSLCDNLPNMSCFHDTSHFEMPQMGHHLRQQGAHKGQQREHLPAGNLRQSSYFFLLLILKVGERERKKKRVTCKDRDKLQKCFQEQDDYMICVLHLSGIKISLCTLLILKS